MTDHGGAASPRCSDPWCRSAQEAPAPEGLRVHPEFIRGYNLGIAECNDEDRAEAPAPEGLRTRHRHKHGAEFRFDHDHHWPHHHHFETSEPVWWEGPMPVAPPTPAEPPRHHLLTDFSVTGAYRESCTCGCPHSDRAEARPPEGLDAAWAAAEAALPKGWAINLLWGTVTSERWGANAGPWPSNPGDPQTFGGGDTPAAALLALAVRLSAGGATLGNRPDVATPRVAKATRGAKGAR